MWTDLIVFYPPVVVIWLCRILDKLPTWLYTASLSSKHYLPFLIPKAFFVKAAVDSFIPIVNFSGSFLIRQSPPAKSVSQLYVSQV